MISRYLIRLDVCVDRVPGKDREDWLLDDQHKARPV
jgi:hypothetical protein